MQERQNAIMSTVKWLIHKDEYAYAIHYFSFLLTIIAEILIFELTSEKFVIKKAVSGPITL